MADSQHITIKDIAQHANVAVSTVSRVLNNLDRVSPATRQKVLDTVKELGFTPNSIAVSMVTGQTKMILIVVPDFINSFFGAVIQGAEQYLRAHGYLTMVTSTEDKANTQISAILKQLDYAVDGAIIIPTGDSAEKYKSFSKDIVFVDRTIPDANYDAVQVDNFGGAYQLTENLIRAGHSKIGIITGGSRLNIGRDRLNGCIQAMKDNGLLLEERFIARGELYEEDGYRHTYALLRQPDPPTAVIACNNLICSGCLFALREMGLTIGRDISLVAFDDQLLASMSQPGITVIDRPTTEMGSMAARMLLERLQSDSPGNHRTVTMPVKLICRNSVCNLSPHSAEQ